MTAFKRIAEDVAPHVGAWIEMWIHRIYVKITVVAPHVGAWIEI